VVTRTLDCQFTIPVFGFVLRFKEKFFLIAREYTLFLFHRTCKSLRLFLYSPRCPIRRNLRITFRAPWCSRQVVEDFRYAALFSGYQRSVLSGRLAFVRDYPRSRLYRWFFRSSRDRLHAPTTKLTGRDKTPLAVIRIYVATGFPTGKSARACVPVVVKSTQELLL